MDGHWRVKNYKDILSLLQNKEGILPICNRISTTVWSHHLNFNEVWWELHKDAAYCFQKILETAL